MKRICIALSLIALAAGCTTPQMTQDSSDLSFLTTKGRDIVNDAGEVVQLRGCNSGNWLLIEPWIIGFNDQGLPTEKDIWDRMAERFGEEKKLSLIRTYRAHFFTEADVQRIAESGMNCVRIPIWWRATDDPSYGGDIAYLDDCLAWCEKYGVYAIIDLHGTPGGQSDNITIIGEPSKSGLWKNEKYREQTIAWWTNVASRYKDNPVVAGYDLINEAMDAQVDELVALYERIYDAIRALGDEHILFIEDGLLGFHRLPLPADKGWENVSYSFHYYPQTPEEAFRAAGTILPEFNRLALHYDCPILVGEFNTMLLERGGIDLFERYASVFDHYGWSWTFWTYKMLEDNGDYNWGLYGYYANRPSVDLNNASFEDIEATLKAMETDEETVQPLLLSALKNPRSWDSADRDTPLGNNAIVLGLDEAFVLPGANGKLKIEWNWNPPNLGYWGATDTVGWRFETTDSGVYELGIIMANAQNGNTMSVFIDGVHVTDASLPDSGGWRSYTQASLGAFHLEPGSHTIQLRQADRGDSFINMRCAWLKPTSESGKVRKEDRIELRPLNVAGFNKGTSIRIEWFNNPPNFGHWEGGQSAHFEIPVETGGAYHAEVEYASPIADTVLLIEVDGAEHLRKTLPRTGDWHAFTTLRLGELDLKPGTHKIRLVWETDNPSGAGNLRGVCLDRGKKE
jgi:hypothetical protein